MPATIGTAIAAVYQVTFGHYPITFFHVKILPFLNIIRKTIGVSKYVIKIAHSILFPQK
jgi:hypothetical protein